MDDPWAWNIEVAVAAGAAAVSLLPAAVTAVFAWLAWQQTRRANDLALTAQVRDGRARLALAAGSYLDFWQPFRTPDPRPQSLTFPAAQALHTTAASISDDAAATARWLLGAINDADLAYATQAATMPQYQMPDYGALLIRTIARERIANWVATGRLDVSPLLASPA